MKPRKKLNILWYLDKIEKDLKKHHTPASNIMNVISHIQYEIKNNFISKEMHRKEIIKQMDKDARDFNHKSKRLILVVETLGRRNVEIKKLKYQQAQVRRKFEKQLGEAWFNFKDLKKEIIDLKGQKKGELNKKRNLHKKYERLIKENIRLGNEEVKHFSKVLELEKELKKRPTIKKFKGEAREIYGNLVKKNIRLERQLSDIKKETKNKLLYLKRRVTKKYVYLDKKEFWGLVGDLK